MASRTCSIALVLAAITLLGRAVAAARGDDDLPTKPAYGIIQLFQIKKVLNKYNDEFKASGMNENFNKQFEKQLNLAIKAYADGKLSTREHKEESFPVITGRMKDMISVSALKRARKTLIASLKEKGASDKVIQQVETQLDQAVAAASEGRFSINDHKDKSFTVIYRRLGGVIKGAAK